MNRSHGRCLLVPSGLLGLVVVACGWSFAGNDLPKLVKTVPLEHVEGRIDHLALSPNGRHLFVAALGNNSVEVIDVQGGVFAGTIKMINEPQGVAYVPQAKKLVVSSGGDGNVRFFDESLAPAGTVNDLPDADNVRYDSRANLIYVGCADGALAVIDPDKTAKVADIKLDGHPESFQLQPHGKLAFVNVPTAREIEVVDREKRIVIGKWQVTEAQANFPMALDEANNRLLVGCRKPSKLLVFDTETGKTVAAMDCCGDVDDVFYDASNKRVYVTGGEGAIGVFVQSDADHYRSLGTVKTASGARTSLFVPEQGMLYVAVPHRGGQLAEVRVYQCPANSR